MEKQVHQYSNWMQNTLWGKLFHRKAVLGKCLDQHFEGAGSHSFPQIPYICPHHCVTLCAVSRWICVNEEL